MSTQGRRYRGVMMIFVGAVNILGVYTSLLFLLFNAVPNENRELVSMLLGNIVGFAAATVAYYFGSTGESADKNATIRTQAEAQLSTATVAAAAVAPPDITIPAGDTVTVTAGESNAQA